ncbi:MAG: microcystin-dependent protein [Rhodothermales bacterium]|jgi:microcystin-dependent protein
MSDPFIGEISLVGFTYAPRSWANCDGQLLPISQNNALFALLGTTYGGDGETTFGLPELRGRSAMHQGQGPGLSSRPLGQKSGVETVTLTLGQMPTHSHSITRLASNSSGTAATPVGNVPAVTEQLALYRPVADANIAGAETVGNAGASQSHDNMPPVLTVRSVICLQGTFPSRN